MKKVQKNNNLHTYRHAWCAWDDFSRLRKKRGNNCELWHSLSHHLRHVVYRVGLDMPKQEARSIRRRYGS
jgi:hypothetical protein